MVVEQSPGPEPGLWIADPASGTADQRNGWLPARFADALKPVY